MNYNLTVSPVILPLAPERAVNTPVAPVGDGASEFRDASKKHPSTYVYRGEIIEPVANHRRYHPQPNLQTTPQTRRAIETYQKVLKEPPLMGQLLDGFV